MLAQEGGRHARSYRHHSRASDDRQSSTGRLAKDHMGYDTSSGRGCGKATNQAAEEKRLGIITLYSSTYQTGEFTFDVLTFDAASRRLSQGDRLIRGADARFMWPSSRALNSESNLPRAHPSSTAPDRAPMYEPVSYALLL
jgi:hypothetical protein